jgi:WD40 repeat protein
LISGCGYNQEGNRAFSMSSSGIIEIWKTQTSSCENKVEINITLCLGCLISSNLEIGLIRILDDMLHNLYLIDLNSGEWLLVFNEQSSQISDFALSDNGEMIISASKNELHLIGIKNQEYGYMVLEEYSETTEKLVSCDLNEDGLIILTAYDNGILGIRDLRKKSLIEIESKHTDEIAKCVISCNGLIAVSSSKDKTLKIWNTITGDCIDTLPIDSDLHHCIISNDNQFLLYSQTRDTIQIVNIHNGQTIGKFTFDSWVSALAFSPDSTQIMVGDYSGCVHFLQLEGLNTSEKQLL